MDYSVKQWGFAGFTTTNSTLYTLPVSFKHQLQQVLAIDVITNDTEIAPEHEIVMWSIRGANNKDKVKFVSTNGPSVEAFSYIAIGY